MNNNFKILIIAKLYKICNSHLMYPLIFQTRGMFVR